VHTKCWIYLKYLLDCLLYDIDTAFSYCGAHDKAEYFLLFVFSLFDYFLIDFILVMVLAELLCRVITFSFVSAYCSVSQFFFSLNFVFSVT
jgi:hypothetical protein